MRSTRKEPKFVDDLARVILGSVGSLDNVKRVVKAAVKERVEAVIDDLDLVSRREFNRVEAIAAKARARQEELEERIEKLEKMLKAKKAVTMKGKAKK